MTRTCRVKKWRTVLVLGSLLGALACGDTQCDCVAPLWAPLPEAELMPDAVQLKVTPSAFALLEQSLPALLESFLPGGLVFPVPPMHQDLDAVLFTLSVDICADGCELAAEINQAALTRVAPDRLRLDAFADLGGVLDLSGDVLCDVPIHIQDKPISAEVVFLRDERSGLLTFTLQGLTVSVVDQDYTLDCRGQLGDLVEAMKAFLTQMMNEQIGGQLDSALAGMLEQATCLACDTYAGGCPGGSTCDGELCLDGADRCLTNPLGLVGTVDAGALLGAVVPGLSAELDLTLALGQQGSPVEDPVIVDDGLALRLLAGLDAAPSACVPEPDPAEVPGTAPPPRLAFLADGTVPGTGQAYMLGLGVGDAFLDRALYKAYRAGMLCLSLDSRVSEMLSSGTLAALMGSLDTLTHGANAPVRLGLRPQRVPGLVVGEGTFTVDGDGNKIIDDPLLRVVLPEVAIDFYVRIEERWQRVLTLTQDMEILLGLDLLPDNRLLPVLDEHSIAVGPSVASNYGLLAEDPEALANLVPTLLGLAVPALTEGLGTMTLPEVEGFLLNVVALRGEMPKPAGEPGFEHLALYADLGLTPAPAPRPRETRARLVSIELPPRAAMSIRAPGGPSVPAARVRVEDDGRGGLEYSWRLDGAGWSVFRPGPELVVRSPLLLLTGEHRLEVRARSIGDYRSLDPSPEVVRLVVDPPRVPRGGLLEDVGGDRSGFQAGRPWGAELEIGELVSSDPGPAQTGCATPGGEAGLGALAAFLVLCLARRRR